MKEKDLINQIDVLKLEDGDILAMHVDIGSMSTKKAQEYVLKLREGLAPMFKERGIETIYIPNRGTITTKFQIVRGEEDVD